MRVSYSAHSWAPLWACLILSLVAPPIASAQARSDHVILISIDGMRPEFYLDPAWPAPMIQQMAREGAHAERVRSVFPSVTSPSHATVVTGALPARHGVYYNRPFEPEGQTGRWYWNESAIKIPTLWDAVRSKGGKTAAVVWPVTVGAPIDWVVPGVWSVETGNRTTPMRAETRPAGLWAELEREATGRMTDQTYLFSWISRDDKTADAAAYLLERHRPDLLAVHLAATDHFQHEDGRNSDRVRRSVSSVDHAISNLVEAAERAGILDRTTFIVAGDHGHVDVHTVLAPNVWLAEAGLQEAKADRGDWRATFHTAAGAAFLHLKNSDDAEALEQARLAIDRVPARLGKLFRVVERSEMDRIGADPNAQFALAASLGVQFTASAGGAVARPGSGATHGFFPSDFPEIYTGFIAWGAGIESGAVVHTMGLEDIAPIIDELLDLSFEAPDGSAPLGILTPRGRMAVLACGTALPGIYNLVSINGGELPATIGSWGALTFTSGALSLTSDSTFTATYVYEGDGDPETENDSGTFRLDESNMIHFTPGSDSDDDEPFKGCWNGDQITVPFDDGVTFVFRPQDSW